MKNEDKLKNKIEEKINNGWLLMVSDTHRWCKSDGFYEMRFFLKKEEKTIYLHSYQGGKDLEDCYSKNNPQEIPICDLLTFMYETDCEIAYENILDEK